MWQGLQKPQLFAAPSLLNHPSVLAEYDVYVGQTTQVMTALVEQLTTL